MSKVAQQIPASIKDSYFGATMNLTRPAGLRRFRKALDDALFTTAEIQVIGGSSAFGWGADNVPVNYPSQTAAALTDLLGDKVSWVAQLRAYFNSYFSGAGPNPPGYLHTSQDAVVKVGGFVQDRGHLAYARVLTSSGESLTYTVPACTALDFDVWENAATTGSWTYKVDGAAPVTVTVTPGAVAAYRRVSVTGLANTAHTVIVSNVNSTATIHLGMRWHSSYGVAVGRHAVAGWTVSDAMGQGPNKTASDSGKQLDMVNAFGSIPGCLNIIVFGSNDFVLQNPATKTDIASYEAGLRTLVAKNTAAGGCTLLLSSPDRDPAIDPAPSPSRKTLNDYWDVMRKIASDTDHVAHARHGDVLGTWAQAWAAGLMADHAHPVRAGAGLMASATFKMLTSLPGPAGGADALRKYVVNWGFNDGFDTYKQGDFIYVKDSDLPALNGSGVLTLVG